MATIYNVGGSTDFYLDFSNTNTYLRGHVIVTLNSQNQAARTSTCTVNLYLYKTTSTATEDTTFRGSINFGGVTDSYSTRLAYLATSEQLVYSGYFTVSHGADGTYSGSLSATCTYGTRPTSSGSETIILPTIPVNSTFTITPTGTLVTGQTTITISISSPDPSWTYTMNMRNNAGTVALFTRISNTTWTGVLPSTLDALLPNSQTGTINFDLISYTSGGTQLGTYTIYRTVSVGNTGGPSISNIQITAVDANDQQVAYGYVAGVSYLHIEFNVSDTSGSVISSVKTTIGSYEYTATIEGTSGVILTQHPVNDSGTVTITLVGTNTRGGTGSSSTTITVQSYYIPRIDVLSAVRSDQYGNTVPQGTYAKVEYKFEISPITGYNNTYTYTLSYKLHSQSTWTNLKYRADQTLPAGTTIIDFTDANAEIYSGFSSTDPYDIRLQVTDLLTGDNGRASKTLTMGIDQVIIDLKYDGTGIGFGKTSEDSGIADFGWFVRFAGGIFPVALEDDSNLNTLKVPGFYYGDTTSITVTGLPTGVSGNYGLFITPTGVNSVLQMLTPESVGSDPTIYVRTVSTSGQLSSWALLSDSSIMNLYSFLGGVELLENTNIDTIVTTGNYYCRYNSYASTMTGLPSTVSNRAFTLKVFSSNGYSSTYLKQELKSLESNYTFRRFSTDGGQVWGRWQYETLNTLT